MASILKKAANYKRISSILCEGEAHLRDPFTPPPVILKVLNLFFVVDIILLKIATSSKKREKT